MEVNREAKALFDDCFSFYMEAYPEIATFTGIHAYDARLCSYDKSSIDARLRKLRELKRRAKDLLSHGQLSVSERIDTILVANNCDVQLLETEKMLKPWTDPTYYIEMSLFGMLLLSARDVLPLEERARSIAARFKEFGRVLGEARENLENPPRIFTTTAIGMLKGAHELVKEIVGHFGKEVPRVRPELEANAESCIDAVSRFETYLQCELLPRSTGEFAIGRELFESKLRIEHMINQDAVGLERMGRDLLETTKEQMEQLSQELAPGRNWKDVIDARKGKHPSAGGLRMAYETHMKRARDFVVEKELVPIPPGESLRVIDTPVFERTTIPYAAYVSPGAFDEKQEGLFFVTPVNTSAAIDEQEEQLKGHSYPSMVLTALHEAYPGHHLQLVYSNRVTSKIRRIFFDSVFAEGWALYCEEMMKEAGFYESKEIQMFQLKDMLWRAARVVIDVGLHTRTMSFDEAVQFLISEAVVEKANAVAEVTRYTNSPTQPSSYALGRAEIFALREEEKNRLGSGFSLSDFHGKLLGSGTIPFELVKEEFRMQA